MTQHFLKVVLFLIFCATHTQKKRDFSALDSHPRPTEAKLRRVLVADLHGRRSFSVAEHRVEGMSKVVGLSAVVLLGQRQQEGEDHQQEQEELERQREPEDAAPERGPASRRHVQIRTAGSGSSGAARPAHTHSRPGRG